MPTFAPWLQQPDFLGAERAGAEIGLSEAQMHQQAAEHAADLALRRDELAAQMSRAAADRGQQDQENNAAAALRQEALKQEGLFRGQELDNQANAITARSALEKFKMGKPQFFNTGNGLVKVDPVTGIAEPIPNTAKPPAQRFESTPTYIPPVAEVPDTPADVTTHWFSPNVTNSPAIKGSPKIPGHWYNKRTPVTPNAPAPANDAAAALRTAQSQLPDFGPLPAGQPAVAPAATTAPQFKSATEVKTAYKNKQISFDDAVKLLTDKFPLDLEK